MDLQLYYAKLRQEERGISEEFPIIVSQETANGGKAGKWTEVPKRIAAKFVVQGLARLANAEEATAFRASQTEAKKAAEEAEKAAAAAEQMMQGRFNLEDFLEQLRQMRKLGPIQDILKMLPGVPGGKNAVKEMAEAVDEAELRRAEAMILSMTREERRNPAIISGSRRLRIADGSGTTTADVNQLLKDFEGARKMMRSMMGGKRLPGMAKVPGVKP